MATSHPTASRRWTLRLGGTPVFLYHGLGTQAEPECSLRERKYWVSEARFCEHMKSVRNAGYLAVPLWSMVRSMPDARSEQKVIVISFDDGLESDYKVAFPILLVNGMRAEFFINPANVGRKGFLNWGQVSEMHAAGMSFQSHSFDHVDLVRLSTREKDRQLQLSKSILEDKLGERVDFLSVPYGRISDEVVNIAMAAGYQGVCTSKSWPARPEHLLINRVAVYSRTTAREFEALLAGNVFSYGARTARAAMLFLPKFIFSRLTRIEKGIAMLGRVV